MINDSIFHAANFEFPFPLKILITYFKNNLCSQLTSLNACSKNYILSKGAELCKFLLLYVIVVTFTTFPRERLKVMGLVVQL